VALMSKLSTNESSVYQLGIKHMCSVHDSELTVFRTWIRSPVVMLWPPNTLQATNELQ